VSQDILELDRMPRLNLKALFGALIVGTLGLATLMPRGFSSLSGAGNMAHRRRQASEAAITSSAFFWTVSAERRKLEALPSLPTLRLLSYR